MCMVQKTGVCNTQNNTSSLAVALTLQNTYSLATRAALHRVNYGSIGLGHLKAGEFRVVGAGGVEGGFVARCLEGGK